MSDPLNPEVETNGSHSSTSRPQHETNYASMSTTCENAERASERPAVDADGSPETSGSSVDAPTASDDPSAAAGSHESDLRTPPDPAPADVAVPPAGREKTNPTPLHRSQEREPADAPASRVGSQRNPPATSRDPHERGPGDAVSLAGRQGSDPAVARHPHERRLSDIA